MTESGKRLNLATLSEKIEKLTLTELNALQNHTDDKLTAMLEEIKGIRLSQDFLCEKYEDMKKKLETITVTFHNLQEENNNLKNVVPALQIRSEKMESDINELEQYSRRCYLEFKGIAYEKNENTDQLIVQVANKIGVKLHPSDISISHRMAPSTPTHPNPNIIVKFLSRKVRDNIYSKRIKLKVANVSLQPRHSKVFINESLTKQNRERFKKCNDFKKKAGYKFI